MELHFEFLEPQRKLPNPRWFIPAVILAILLAISIVLARAETIPQNLWQGLIAEDVSGGYEGMYAVACCVRNRLNAGLNSGLVALKRKDLSSFVNKQPKKYHVIAKDIVNKVFYQNSPDVTRGATHYEAVERYGLPKWAKNMQKTIKIGEHTYFKRRIVTATIIPTKPYKYD